MWLNPWKNAASMISSARILAAPLFFYAVKYDQQTGAIMLWLFACATDVVDGYIARQTQSASTFGAYLDVTADFLFIFTAFATFVQRDIYPGWLLLIIGGMFGQFLLTSRQRRLVYDPIGKYYGAILFAAIGITLLLVDFAVQYAMLMSIVCLTGASLLSRWVLTSELRKPTK